MAISSNPQQVVEGSGKLERPFMLAELPSIVKYDRHRAKGVVCVRDRLASGRRYLYEGGRGFTAVTTVAFCSNPLAASLL